MIGHNKALYLSLPWANQWAIGTYVSANSFTIPVDVTAIYVPGQAIRIVNGSSTYYSYIVSAVYSTSTTVTIADSVLASAAISSDISILQYNYAVGRSFNEVRVTGSRGFSVRNGATQNAGITQAGALTAVSGVFSSSLSSPNIVDNGSASYSSLKYATATKLQTTTTGITVTGQVTASTFAGQMVPYSANEMDLCYGFSGGEIHLNYRGASSAITTLIINNGVGNGGLAGIYAAFATFTGALSASNFSGSSSGTNTGDQTTITGNAATATALQNARLIAGVSFNGTANIAIPFANLSSTPTTIAGYGITDSLTYTNVAATITSNWTFTGVTITGTAVASIFDGHIAIQSANEIDICEGFAGGIAYLNYRGATAAITELRINDGMGAGAYAGIHAAAATFTGALSASNFSGSSSGTNTGDQTTITGNAATATALQNARLIAGVSFNGTANIAIPFANLSSTPTTIAGYGITDSLTYTNVAATITSNWTFDDTVTFNGEVAGSFAGSGATPSGVSGYSSVQTITLSTPVNLASGLGLNSTTTIYIGSTYSTAKWAKIMIYYTIANGNTGDVTVYASYTSNGITGDYYAVSAGTKENSGSPTKVFAAQFTVRLNTASNPYFYIRLGNTYGTPSVGSEVYLVGYGQ